LLRAAYGIYHAGKIYYNCVQLLIYTLSLSIKHCLVCTISNYIKRYFGK